MQQEIQIVYTIFNKVLTRTFSALRWPHAPPSVRYIWNGKD